jgi:anhydro-N-acetylmuramic acid kinase
MTTWHAIGIMSGTSLDGIDAALLVGDGHAWAVAGGVARPLPSDLRRGLLAAAEDAPLPPSVLARLARALSEEYAAAVADLLAQTGTPRTAVAVVGMHGQTIHHTPPPDGVTWQLGWPGWVAARTGLVTAGDFRVPDVARGGQGAPLAPLAHRVFFGHPRERRVVLNVGGIANVTVLEPGGRLAAAWDTGPGNMVLDGVMADATDGRERRDDDGRRARAGTVSAPHLATLLADPYFAQPAPKSTGRERFGRAFRAPLATLSPEDAAATATALTVETIRQAVATVRPDRVIAAGGGVRNLFLMERLAAALPAPLEISDAHGIPAQFLEAAVFAWLGWACLRGRRHSLRPITGGGWARLGVLARP